METPTSDSGALDLPGRLAGGAPPPRPLSPAAAGWLDRMVVPSLRRRKNSGLARTVRDAVRDSETQRLADLPERERRTLLAIVEERLADEPTVREPKVVVEIAAFLGGVPEPEVRLSRWRTAPAR